jgi:hypothetical protein
VPDSTLVECFLLVVQTVEARLLHPAQEGARGERDEAELAGF